QLPTLSLHDALPTSLADAEVPVMAHLGLTPQSVHRLGGFKVQGRGDAAREHILQAAEAAEAAGAFSLVLECVPSDLAAEVTARLDRKSTRLNSSHDQ